MRIKPISTRPLVPPKDDLLAVIKDSVKEIKEKSILAITSKVVSIWQGRCVKIGSTNKEDLIKQEADLYLDREKYPNKYATMTIKNNIMIPTSGIDESNGNGYYILWPDKPFETAKTLYSFLKREYGLKKFGIIITDSHTSPLRLGVTGIAVSYFGFNPLKNYAGSKDIFGRVFKFSQANIADSIATASALVMGEGSEQTPMAIVENIDFVEFNESGADKLKVDMNDDLYGPLVNSVNWSKGNSGV